MNGPQASLSSNVSRFFLRRKAQPLPQWGQFSLFMFALVIIYYLFIIYLFTDECIYWEAGVSWETKCRGCLGSDMFSVKMELNSRLFPPGLLASVPLFAFIFQKYLSDRVI